MSGLNNNAMVNVTVSIYSLTNRSTIDNPLYRLSNKLDIQLEPKHFETLGSLQDAIAKFTNAGFLRSQFFRICSEESFPGRFITSTAILAELVKDGVIPDSLKRLAVIRYTRAQCSHLRPRVSREELFFLDNVLRIKRQYNRMPIVINSTTTPPQSDNDDTTIRYQSRTMNAEQQRQALEQAAMIADANQERPQTLNDALLDIKRVCGSHYFRPYPYAILERTAALYRSGALRLRKIFLTMMNNEDLRQVIGCTDSLEDLNRNCTGIPTIPIEVPLDLVDEVNLYLSRRLLELEKRGTGY
ncbi:hypothetical protein GMRT_11767 [Giardia muris]|uniref:Uncharacterized protein n=1 Tax=Giardia muris TaxID=5742 RepID=A0A4Z1ST91_GIAMU|nr:hypothetical protein GMRT_11767 [Giardia muris]|eukprot:TNJ29114.1 hypothetical protein GMRT_11767 [Giardia muris]